MSDEAKQSCLYQIERFRNGQWSYSCHYKTLKDAREHLMELSSDGVKRRIVELCLKTTIKVVK